MGSSVSKASKATGAAARRYPARSNNTGQVPPLPHTSPGPVVKPSPQASATRDAAINRDASDPDFVSQLRSIGPVQPNPTLSPTSAFPHPRNPDAVQRQGPDPRANPALAILDARSRLQIEADKEFIEAGARDHEGRQFLDIINIRQILLLRDQQGLKDSEIEERLDLKKGVVGRLGPAGVVELATEQGRAQKGVELV